MSKRACQPTQALSRDWVTSGVHVQVFAHPTTTTMATLGPVRLYGMSWTGWALRLAREPAVTRAELSLHFPGARLCICGPHTWSPYFPQYFFQFWQPSIQPSGLIFPPRAPGLGIQSVAWTVTLQNRVISLCNFLWVPSRGNRSQPGHFSSLSTWLHMYLSFILGCTWVLPPVSS